VDLAGGDDDAELDLPPGGPVHPDDRLWRHPSEIRSTGAPDIFHLDDGLEASRDAGPLDPRGHRRPRVNLERWLPMVLAAGVSALLTAGFLGATGSLDASLLASGSPAAPTSSSVALAVHRDIAALEVAELAERLRPSLLALAGVAADGRPSRGSAVAIRTGHVLTAARLVVGSREVQVLVHGVGRRATLVGSDPDTDLAVLAVDGGGLEPAAWSRAGDLQPGARAVAVSSPPAAEAGPTVTAGVVSGISRTCTFGGNELRGLLQLDRPVPAEGAGGALLDPEGALLGITLPAPQGAAPFGYAVPAEEAEEVAGQLLTRGRVAHPWLGVEGGDRGMDGGAVVQRVRPASPAATAGLQEGDVVTSFSGRATPSMGALLLRLRLHRPGEVVRLTVLRAGLPLDIPVTLAERV